MMTTLDIDETVQALDSSIREWRRILKRAEEEPISRESSHRWTTARCYIDAYQCVRVWLTGAQKGEDYHLSPANAAALAVVSENERKCDDGRGHVKPTATSEYCECRALKFYHDGTIAPSGWATP